MGQQKPDKIIKTLIEEKDHDRLAALLETADWVFKFQAAAALLELQDERGWIFLAGALKHQRKDIRGAALEVAAEKEGEQTYALLHTALDDPHTGIRFIAAETLYHRYAGRLVADGVLKERVEQVLRENPAYRPPATPEVEHSLKSMEFYFALLGILGTIVALGFLVLGISQFRFLFILFCILSAAGFTGRRGIERRDRQGYYYALAGSLLFLIGIPLYTVPGLLILRTLLKGDIMVAFGLTL